MKLLRGATNLEVRKMVYITLCQSLIQYCIGAWGGTCKTTMIELERAQRAVLKVMLGKPRRFPTALLYPEAEVLSVRQLFICQAVLKVLKTKPKLVVSSRRRAPRLPLPKTRTVFVRRFSRYLHTHIFNKVADICDLTNCSHKEAKTIIRKWLKTLTYDETERLTFILQ